MSLLIDYRGYGKSRGKPDQQGHYRDAAPAWGYLTEEKGIAANDHILIFGRSLGGAVAARLASGVQARGFARAVFPLLSRLVLIRYDFNIAENIQHVHYPVPVLHSPDDKIMPFHLGERVFQAAQQPKHFVRMQGDHNNGFLLSQPEYAQEFDRWLQGMQRTMQAPL